MNVELLPGVYVVAVSGGVDSVVLLDLLVQQYGPGGQLPGSENKQQAPICHLPSATYHFIVAHFDHGIREESGEDRLFVQQLAERYGLPFEYAEGKLGPAASEEAARTARYKFLREMREKYGAAAIVTAHHQDDVLETAILNLLRGTGRKGLTSLASNGDISRPLLHVPKQTITTYARSHNLAWHEDSTNLSPKYLRNYIRLQLLPKFSEADRARLLGTIERGRTLNAEIDALLTAVLPAGATLDRQWFIILPHKVATEVMAAWLRRLHIREFDRKTIERLVVMAKTGRSSSAANIYGPHMLRIGQKTLALDHKER